MPLITPKSARNAARQTPSSLQPAGFWMRVVACMVDGAIVLLGGFITGMLAMLPAVALLAPLLISLSEFQRGEVGKQIFGLGFLIFSWLYFAWMESSRWQATPGKMLLQLRLVGVDGTRLSFGRATGRFFGKFLSIAIMYIGFIMVAFTSKKQGLHDIMAGCLVVKNRCAEPSPAGDVANRAAPEE